MRKALTHHQKTIFLWYRLIPVSTFSIYGLLLPEGLLLLELLLRPAEEREREGEDERLALDRELELLRFILREGELLLFMLLLLELELRLRFMLREGEELLLRFTLELLFELERLGL